MHFGGACLALGQARLHTRLRAVRRAILNPVTIIAAVIGGVLSFLVLLHGDNESSRFARDTFVDTASIVLGVMIGAVGVTSQRGSPLRWSAADVSWTLPSKFGPFLLVLEQLFASALAALFLPLVFSALSLSLQGRAPWLALASSLSVAAIVLFVRALSIGLHDIGTLSQILRWLIVALSILWILVWIGETVLSLGFVPGFDVVNDVKSTVMTLLTGIIRPESADPALCAVVISVAMIIAIPAVVRPNRLIEPAARESANAAILVAALSGSARPISLGGGHYSTGLASRKKWPRSPLAAIRLCGWSQIRRRRKQSIILTVILCFAGGIVISSHPDANVWIAVGIAMIVLGLASPAQTSANQLSHQHVWMSRVPATRALFYAMIPDAVLYVVTLLAVAVVGVVIQPRSWAVTSVILLVAPLAAITVTLAGIVGHSLSSSPIVRAMAGTMLATVPVLVPMGSLLVYQTASSALVILTTFGVSMLISAALYAVVAWAAFADALASPESTPPTTAAGSVN